VPTLLISMPSHSQRKAGRWSGAQAGDAADAEPEPEADLPGSAASRTAAALRRVTSPTIASAHTEGGLAALCADLGQQ
jgi:hypothetical protein